MRWLITGASGQLGGYLLRELAASGEPIVAWSGSPRGPLFGVDLRPVDLANPDGVAAAFREARPEGIVHAAALAMVRDCYRDPERARQVNTRGTEILAELAAAAGARFVLTSTDLVFDGERGHYREDDPPGPLSVYGRTKAAAEGPTLAAGGVVARVSLLYGPTLVGRPAFFGEQVMALRAGKPVTLFEDEWRTPLSLETAVRALLAVARSDFRGVLHVGGPERLSRLEMGRRLAAYLGVDSSVIRVARREEFAAPEPRPRDTSLDSGRWRRLFPGQQWPTLEEALRQG
jgi:dTDP-4-dehydrorhamnose reductase